MEQARMTPDPVPNEPGTSTNTTTNQYRLLLELDKKALVPNAEESECMLCSKMVPIGQGVLLVNCLHLFCIQCLKNFLLEATTIRCPVSLDQYECDGSLNQQELTALLTEQQYDEFMERQLDAIQKEVLTMQVATEESENLNLQMILSNAGLVPNPEPFDCLICSKTYQTHEGVLLLDCLHSFCRNCLRDFIEKTEDNIFLCPNKTNNNPCGNSIEDWSIQCLLSIDCNGFSDQPVGIGDNKHDCETQISALDCSPPSEPPASTSTAENHYQQLLELDKQALVHNVEDFECTLCTNMVSIGKGVLLVNCLHAFCIECLKNFLLGATSSRCPFSNGQHECEEHLDQRELEALLSAQEHDDLIKRQLEAIQNGMSSMHVTNASTEVSEDLDLLMTLTDASVVPNPEPFDCPICFDSYEAYEGVILRECFHSFCRDCIINCIKHADDVFVLCPFDDGNYSCECLIQDREIRCLLGVDEYNAYSRRSLQKAESLAHNAFHCKTPDCSGWCLVEGDATSFTCPICSTDNCLKCKTIHANMSCTDYQDRLNRNKEADSSEQSLKDMIASKIAMLCPTCKIVLTKIDGCDYLTCSVCKTAVCWATRGPRWGPGGTGDTSGGCRCGVNGVRCHPSCMNCH